MSRIDEILAAANPTELLSSRQLLAIIRTERALIRELAEMLERCEREIRPHDEAALEAIRQAHKLLARKDVVAARGK